MVGEFRKIESVLTDKAEGSEAISQFKKDFVRKSVECESDQDGYIQIPVELIEQAHLKNRVMLSEFVDHVEIGTS